VQAYACHPLIIEGQSIGTLSIGTLSFGTNSRTGFTDEEIEVRTVAAHISIAMNRLISNHALKEAHDNLEEQVNERTSELKKTGGPDRSYT
jgi:GAF domain-containing protein